MSENWVAIHLGHGNTTFDPALKSSVAGVQTNIDEVPEIAVADVNGDGKPDIVSVAGHAGVVTVLLNSTSPGTGGGGGGGSGGGGGTGAGGGATPVIAAATQSKQTWREGSKGWWSPP